MKKSEFAKLSWEGHPIPMNRSVEGVSVGGCSTTNETRELLQGLRPISISPVTSQRQKTTRLHRCI